MLPNETIPNLLITQKSPYLLQHAYNPVHWHPWGREAFETAKNLDLPVFLSIGYSTCHWCHVMAHESFEDLEVAEILNNNFICIKVDKEERPDVDSVYMSACQAMTGQGGWPLTVFLNPDQTPFHCATYIPKYSKYSYQGLMELLPEISRLWNQNRYALTERSEAVKNYLGQSEQKSQGKEPDKSLLDTGYQQFKKGYDPINGGFHKAPKFPSPHNLLFLLRYRDSEKANDALEMTEKTLIQMYRGGLFDHIGGGFSRYSTDEKWLVPHFEKMLYDNALLSLAYLETYRVTSNNLFKTVAQRTLDYVLSDLTDIRGGFYCGQDADSEGVEGKFYVFSRAEMIDLLGSEDGEFFIKWYGITEAGNFEGENILNLLDNPQYEEYPERIEAINKRLFSFRKERTQLHKDDKVLTSWNGLMIASFAKAYCILGDIRYLEAAKNAQSFIERALRDENGRLKLRWREGESAGNGILDDYAFYCFGLLTLYQCRFDVQYLTAAIKTARDIVNFFYDKTFDGCFLYASDSEQLINRPKELYDGAMPSGNAIAAQVFITLAALTGDPFWEETAYRQICFLSGNISDYPAGYSASLYAISQVLYTEKQLVCAVEGSQVPQEFLDTFRAPVFENIRIIVKTETNAELLSQICPFTADYPIEADRAAFYLCQDKVCSPPVYSLRDLIKNLS